MSPRVRKVKCDEGRPSCHRCISTGRNCDGYGIWGGGGIANTQGNKANHVTQHCYVGGQPPTMKWIPRNEDWSLASVRLSTAERGCYAWFFSKTSMKFSGIFCAPFWRRLVPQACFAEPAILREQRSVFFNTPFSRGNPGALILPSSFVSSVLA